MVVEEGGEAPWESVDIMVNEQFARGMWEYFTLKGAEAKRIRDDAAREKQEGIQGVAAGISIQGDPGAGQKKLRYGMQLRSHARKTFSQ